MDMSENYHNDLEYGTQNVQEADTWVWTMLRSGLGKY